MYQHLLSKLNSNSVVLTPNRRLAATVHKLYQQQQQQSYWLTPDILPLSTWVQRLWKEYTSKEFFKKPLLLTPTQEIFIWEKIINQSTRGTQLLRLSETAELARSAWNTLQQWEISLDAKIFETTQDYLALQYWGNEFITYCRQGNVIDNASLLTYLNAQLQKIELPQHIYLLGFTELTPQLNTFLTTCKQNGCEVTSVENSSAHASVFRISVSDHETEILSMARWAKQKLAENSKSYIGCVIPSLDKIRSRVFQLFSEVFSTENNYHLDTKSPFFNISAGKPLSQFPIIHAALQLCLLYTSPSPRD